MCVSLLGARLGKFYSSFSIGRRQLDSREAETRVRHPNFNGPREGARPLRPRHPSVEGPLGRRGFSAADSRLSLPRGALTLGPSRALGARCPAQPLLAPRPPGAQHEGGAGLQPPPRRLGQDPREFGPPALRLRRPQPPGLSALLPLGAPGAKPATREQSAARTVERRTLGNGPSNPDRSQSPRSSPPACRRPDHGCRGTRAPRPALRGGAAPAGSAAPLRAGGW